MSEPAPTPVDARELTLELERLIDEGDPERLQEHLDALPEVDVPHHVAHLDAEQRARLLQTLAPEHAASVVDQIPATMACRAMQEIEPRSAAAILEEIPSDERTDLIGEFDLPAAEAILGAMRPEPAAETRALRGYDDEVAGGLMSLEYLSYDVTWTAGQVLEDMRAHAERYRDFVVQYAFLTTAGGRLAGVLRLRDLLFAPADRRVGDLMRPDPMFVRDSDDLDALRAFFDQHAYFGVPVVGPDDRLVGVVQREDVLDALQARNEDTYLKTQGILGEELRSMPLLLRSRRRLAWLSVNILLNVIAASVIAFHQDTLSAVIALAVFLPIISDMSGCSGNQAVAVSMRELALGVVRPSEVRRVWLHEISVGAINGLALGLLLAGVAVLWKGNPFLGLVVGTAMTLNTVIAVSIGGTVPLILRRFGADPALASGPILTTVTDMCGFFLLLGIAGQFLPQLVGG